MIVARRHRRMLGPRLDGQRVIKLNNTELSVSIHRTSRVSKLTFVIFLTDKLIEFSLRINSKIRWCLEGVNEVGCVFLQFVSSDVIYRLSKIEILICVLFFIFFSRNKIGNFINIFHLRRYVKINMQMYMMVKLHKFVP